ncbi:MAG: DNA polymerase I, partial [Planctomycetota bacterium]
MKTLYLIDGHAQFFRAYHAIRSRMTSPVTKEPTNATFGFVGMLLKVLREYTPDYLAVAVDVSGDTETFRSEIFPEYKANRDAPPEDFRPQVERCLSILEAMQIPVLGVEGVEADDTIATIARRITADDPDVKVRIVSKDKDLQQLLVAGRIEMFDVHTDIVIDTAQLLEDKGIAPEQVVDMLALMGDTVDNVPGVPGIGPKTAAQLIAEHGTLDAVVAAARDGAIKGKRGERIQETADALPLSQRLVQLKDDVDVSLALGDAETSSFNLEALEPVLRELGFNRFQGELEELMRGGRPAASPPPATSDAPAPDSLFASLDDAAPSSPGGDYRCVRTQEDLDTLCGELRRAEMIAVDTETTELRAMQARLCGLSFSTAAGTGWYVPVRSPEADTHLDETTVLAALRPILEDPARPKCGHNLKYDLLVLWRAGVELRGVAFDSMIASYLIDASRSSHSLDNLALALLGRTCTPISDLIGTGKRQRSFETVALDRAAPYAAEDADVALQLRDHMSPQLRAMGLDALLKDVEMPLVDVLAELEFNGILVDPQKLDRQAARLGERITELRTQIVDESPRDFNPDSPKQLASVLFNKPDAADPGLGIRPLKRTKTGYSTDVEVLEKLAADPEVESPVPGLIVEYRQLTKLVGTYLTSLKDEINSETARIHASFNQTVAATGRLSSSDPNLQNIPIRTDVGRDIRRAFIAPDGRMLVSADYSQIELRLLAHLSKDPALIEAFHSGADIHTAVAAEIHGVEQADVSREQRNGAKMVNFGIIYGITPWGLARRLGVSQSEASDIIDSYKQRFGGISTFLEECIAQATRFGYVETILKRRRPITDIESRSPQRRALAERMAINSVVQGSAADLIKLAMVDLHAALSPHASQLRDGRPPEVPGTLM